MVRCGTITGCLAGKILRVDLSSGKIWTEDTEEFAEKTLGGRGINSLIMLQEIKPGTTWRDPENILCFGVGALVGTPVPGACRVDISTINVFNNGKGSANVGGFWGPELKYAGYDNILIIGKAKKPVYLYINDKQVELVDASRIWGKTTTDTESALRSELGDQYIEVATIGPAGENRVKGAAIIIDKGKAAGGSGVGCVMGDKRLKAIAVRGHGAIKVSEPDRFMKEILKSFKQCETNKTAVDIMRSAPVNRLADPDCWLWDIGRGIRNGQDEHWERRKRVGLMNRENGIPSFIKTVRACYSCPAGCMPYLEISEGKHRGTKGEGFWLNGVTSACHFDISDPDSMLAFWLLCNELGLDTDYVTAVLAWVFECYQRGLITKDDTSGLDLTWANGDALIKLTRMLAYREGFGNWLADDLIETARKIGQGSEYYQRQIKGQPSIESLRISKSWALGVMTSPIAGRHLRGAFFKFAQYEPSSLDTGYTNQARGVVAQAKIKELDDNLGICSYIGPWGTTNVLTPAIYAGLINTGMGLNLTEEVIMNYYAVIGRYLEIAYNMLHTNLSRKDDFPPNRFMHEEVKSGPYKGNIIDQDKYNTMLNEYYEEMGLDKETGMLTRQGLEKIGLKDIADRLAESGKLIEK